MNPIELAREINDWYVGYLETMFYFRDPVLRDSFSSALSSGYLSKGPYLEATPVFERGDNLRQLVENKLDLDVDHAFLEALNSRRPLYRHQEEAVLKLLEKRNVVVATGTGSGKTECFLLPILFHLYQEFLKDRLGSGTRALILYPMNALANDQRERLGMIAKILHKQKSPFRFTFGQYIGETPEDERDIARHANDFSASRLPGELVFRSEMRQSPPHILLTNYSMLEYLLLRPYDSPLFDYGRATNWQFLVLDEAHQYRGSKGIEMAMLLRRLKSRIKSGGKKDNFICIATSATLAEGDKDKPAIAKFATDLFGEPFHSEEVILGKTDENFWVDETDDKLEPNEYAALLNTFKSNFNGNGRLLQNIANRLNVT